MKTKNKKPAAKTDREQSGKPKTANGTTVASWESTHKLAKTVTSPDTVKRAQQHE